MTESTARVARAAFPKGNRYLRLRDELGLFYQDEDFAELYPDRGQTALAPWRLTMILIMQFLENLSDRQTADSVRGRIDWKYALSMELEDDGFNFTVLTDFRERLIVGSREKQILDKMVSRFNELGLLKSRGKQRTDSTHILAALKELTRLEHLEETLKYTLNTLAEVAPSWLSSVLTPDWYDLGLWTNSKMIRDWPSRILTQELAANLEAIKPQSVSMVLAFSFFYLF